MGNSCFLERKLRRVTLPLFLSLSAYRQPSQLLLSTQRVKSYLPHRTVVRLGDWFCFVLAWFGKALGNKAFN